MSKNAITNLDSSKASGLNFIPVVVLKNCELSHILTTLQYVSEGVLFSRLPVGLIDGPSIKKVGKGLQLKTTALVSLLFVVSKIFKDLNNRLVDHRWPFFRFPVWF